MLNGEKENGFGEGKEVMQFVAYQTNGMGQGLGGWNGMGEGGVA